LPTPRDRLVLEAVRTHGRLTREHVRQLFFRFPNGKLSSVQNVNERLRKLVAAGLLEPVVVSLGRGSGPYAYAIASRGEELLRGRVVTARARGHGPVWHLLEIAEFRVRVQLALEGAGGSLVEWQGEPLLRSLFIRRAGWPLPDALVHWRLERREGAFLLEWDRGSESLAVLTAKLARYDNYWRARGHRELLPGLGLRPRLAIVVPSADRATRLVAWLSHARAHAVSSTVFITVRADVLTRPLGDCWWRSDKKAPGTLFA
jgi:hypothetical protein